MTLLMMTLYYKTPYMMAPYTMTPYMMTLCIVISTKMTTQRYSACIKICFAECSNLVYHAESRVATLPTPVFIFCNLLQMSNVVNCVNLYQLLLSFWKSFNLFYLNIYIPFSQHSFALYLNSFVDTI